MSCFICEGDDARPVFKVCRCDQFVHLDCFTNLVTKVRSHSERCPVCLRAYATEFVLNFDRCLHAGNVLLMTCVWIALAYNLCVARAITLQPVVMFCGLVALGTMHVCCSFVHVVDKRVRAASLQT